MTRERDAKLIDVAAELRHETERAFLLDDGRAVIMSTALATIAWSDAVDTVDIVDSSPRAATVLPLSPFITEPGRRFVLDEDRFATDIEEMPAFLSAPREEYLRAAEIVPLLALLARHQ